MKPDDSILKPMLKTMLTMGYRATIDRICREFGYKGPIGVVRQTADWLVSEGYAVRTRVGTARNPRERFKYYKLTMKGINYATDVIDWNDHDNTP